MSKAKKPFSRKFSLNLTYKKQLQYEFKNGYNQKKKLSLQSLLQN